MKILTWNIWHGGGQRTSGIIETLKYHNSDILILTEFRNNEYGFTISKFLKKIGYLYQSKNNNKNKKQNSVLIASKSPLTSIKDISINMELTDIMVSVKIMDLELIGVYLPSISQNRIPYWDKLIEYCKNVKNDKLIVMGDFNTGDNNLDKSESGAKFKTPEYMEYMAKIGFIDIWRNKYPDKKEYSWYSSKKTNGFRIDHVFGSRAILKPSQEIKYSHKERIKGYSDHSSLILRL